MQKICYEIGTVSNKASSVRMETHGTDHRSGLFKSGMMDTQFSRLRFFDLHICIRSLRK